MKKHLITLIVLVVTITVNAQKDKVNKLVNENKTHLIEVFKDFHQNPELGFMEVRTSKIIATELKDLGYKVIEGIGKTGVVGILENGDGPTVMYRADMDCNSVKEVTGLAYASTKTVKIADGSEVPVMHACGHDAHITWLLGIAKVMAEMKKAWSGTLVLVAQPAEESIEGARAMVDDGMYEKGVPEPDYLFGMHTAPLSTGTVNFEKGPRMAGTDQLDVTFYGIGGHGSSPHLAKDPVLMAATAVVQYQFIVSRAINPLNAAVLTVGSIQAGSDNNVIPASALVKINLRWYKESDRDLMFKAIERINKSIAMTYNMPQDLYPITKYKGWAFPLVNDSSLVDRIRPVVEKVLGEKGIITGFPPTMASEDFHHLVIKNKAPKYLYMFFGTAKPSHFEQAQKEGKMFPYFPHNGNYQVDVDAIPLGVKVATKAILEMFKK
ncbi:MAG: amidohydrolase [Flavobacteriales bacterium]|nr:amidohydrolase [Flavobacteriales bacterium]